MRDVSLSIKEFLSILSSDAKYSLKDYKDVYLRDFNEDIEYLKSLKPNYTPLVIAGNGPSLAKINYSYLPSSFDCYRGNQFYFEEKYFLGREITKAFYNVDVADSQSLTYAYLNAKGIYDIKDTIITLGTETHMINLYKLLKLKNPNQGFYYDYLVKLKNFLNLNNDIRLWENKRFTLASIMLICAIAEGYRNIYISGVDFYEDGGFTYAFNSDKKNLTALIGKVKNMNFKDGNHEKWIDILVILYIRDILKALGGEIYCLNEEGLISTLLPLPSKKSSKEFSVESKASGFLEDILIPPYKMTKKYKSKYFNPSESKIPTLRYRILRKIASFKLIKAIIGA